MTYDEWKTDFHEKPSMDKAIDLETELQTAVEAAVKGESAKLVDVEVWDDDGLIGQVSLQFTLVGEHELCPLVLGNWLKQIGDKLWRQAMTGGRTGSNAGPVG